MGQRAVDGGIGLLADKALTGLAMVGDQHLRPMAVDERVGLFVVGAQRGLLELHVLTKDRVVHVLRGGQ